MIDDMCVILACVFQILAFPGFLSLVETETKPARQVLVVVLMREVVPVLVPVLVL